MLSVANQPACSSPRPSPGGSRLVMTDEGHAFILAGWFEDRRKPAHTILVDAVGVGRSGRHPAARTLDDGRERHVKEVDHNIEPRRPSTVSRLQPASPAPVIPIEDSADAGMQRVQGDVPHEVGAGPESLDVERVVVPEVVEPDHPLVSGQSQCWQLSSKVPRECGLPGDDQAAHKVKLGEIVAAHSPSMARELSPHPRNPAFGDTPRAASPGGRRKGRCQPSIHTSRLVPVLA